jgi:hypothetical protein
LNYARAAQPKAAEAPAFCPRRAAGATAKPSFRKARRGGDICMPAPAFTD